MRNTFILAPLAFCAFLSGQSFAACDPNIGSNSSSIDTIRGNSGHITKFLLRNQTICPGQNFHFQLNAYGFNPEVRLTKCGSRIPLQARYVSGTSTHPSEPFQKAIHYDFTRVELCVDVIFSINTQNLAPNQRYKFDYEHTIKKIGF